MDQLCQESEVILVKLVNIIDAMHQHSEAVSTEPKYEPEVCNEKRGLIRYSSRRYLRNGRRITSMCGALAQECAAFSTCVDVVRVEYSADELRLKRNFKHKILKRVIVELEELHERKQNLDHFLQEFQRRLASTRAVTRTAISGM